MKRRAFLAGAGFALGVPTGIAWGNWREQRSCTEPVRRVETTSLLADVLTDAAREERGSPDPSGAYHRVIASETEAAEVLAEDGDAWSVAARTDFEREFLVLVQVFGSSTPRLVLDCLQRTDDGLEVDVSLTPHSGPRTADLATHSLLLQVGTPRGDVPEAVTLDVDGRNPGPLVERLF